MLDVSMFYKPSYRTRNYSDKDREVPSFKEGDIVRLKTGKSPQKVVKVDYSEKRNIVELTCIYLSSREYHQVSDYASVHLRRPRDQHDFIMYENSEAGPQVFPAKWLGGDYEETKEPDMAQDLYQVKKKSPTDPDRFGNKLTINSLGHIVLEMKGENGKVDTFDPEDIEIVLPYTVQVVGINSGVPGFHFQTEIGKFQKDDVLMEVGSGLMYRVSEVNTRNRSPKGGRIVFLKLQAEKIVVGADN